MGGFVSALATWKTAQREDELAFRSCGDRGSGGAKTSQLQGEIPCKQQRRRPGHCRGLPGRSAPSDRRDNAWPPKATGLAAASALRLAPAQLPHLCPTTADPVTAHRASHAAVAVGRGRRRPGHRRAGRSDGRAARCPGTGGPHSSRRDVLALRRHPRAVRPVRHALLRRHARPTRRAIVVVAIDSVRPARSPLPALPLLATTCYL